MNSEGKILNYLEDKYGEKFVVEGKKEGSILFPKMYGKDKLFVYPKGKPELIFAAGQSRSDEVNYYDGYISAVWGDELTNSLKEALKGKLPEGSVYRVFVNSSEDDPSMKDMSIYDYLKRENKNLMVVLEVAIKTTKEPNLDEYRDGLYQAFEIIKNLQSKYYTLSVGVVDKSEDIQEYIRTSKVNNIPWSNLDAKVYGYLVVDDYDDIKSPEELISKYKPVKE